MWTIFKVFIECVTILLLFHVLVFWLQGMWDLSSPTRDRNHTPCIARWSLNHWTAGDVPVIFVFCQNSLFTCYLGLSSTLKLRSFFSVYSMLGFFPICVDFFFFFLVSGTLIWSPKSELYSKVYSEECHCPTLCISPLTPYPLYSVSTLEL